MVKQSTARLAVLPDPATLARHLDVVLALPRLRDAPLELVRQCLLRTGFRVWCEVGKVVEIEWGVFE